jgi:hypothetical protein
VHKLGRRHNSQLDKCDVQEAGTVTLRLRFISFSQPTLDDDDDDDDDPAALAAKRIAAVAAQPTRAVNAKVHANLKAGPQ